MMTPMVDSAVGPTQRKLGMLEVGRGLAALAVVAHHASLSSDAFTLSHNAKLFSWGIYGVDFFFVLSGFIIYHIHQNDPRQFGAARRFLTKRIRRIYVPYLPITVILISAYLFFPSLSQGSRDWGWFTSLTLMPSDSPPALSVAWTLTFEIIFYLFFLSFFATRFFSHLILGWVLLVAVAAGSEWNYALSNPLISTLLDPLILEFAAGMAAAYLFGKLQSVQWCAPLILGGQGNRIWNCQVALNRVFNVQVDSAAREASRCSLHVLIWGAKNPNAIALPRGGGRVFVCPAAGPPPRGLGGGVGSSRAWISYG